MRAMVGNEELVDPPVARRPLPFSRAWLAAFVLGIIAVGWTAVLIEFDIQSERAHVDRLDAAVSELAKAIATDEAYMVSRSLDDLATVTAGRAASGAEDVDRMWSRVDVITRRAQTLDVSDMTVMSEVLADLEAATQELDQMVTIPEPEGRTRLVP